MKNNDPRQVTIQSILDPQLVRQARLPNGPALYAAVDVLGLLLDAKPEDAWRELKHCDPALARAAVQADFPAILGRPEAQEGLELPDVFRVVQSIASPRADRLKRWLAESAAQHLAETQNPELLALRARKLYEKRGYSRRWVDKRLGGVTARHELTGEWYKRGATESEQFRELTNELMHGAFGMDVEGYRRYKGLTGAGENLRDHMSDLELVLTSLAETSAVALHQARDTHGFEPLRADAREAGRVVARTRKLIEKRCGRPLVTPARHGTARFARHRNPRTPELAERAKDMHNPSLPHAVRTVA